MRLLLPFFLLCFCVPCTAVAQSDNVPTQHGLDLGARAHYGFFIPHRGAMRNLVLGHVKAIELSISKQSHASSPFHEAYGNSPFGLSFHLFDTGNPAQMGMGVAVSPWVQLHFLTTKKFDWDFRGHVGLGYLTKRWDRTENYKNTAIGSHLNAFLSAGTTVNYRVTERLKLDLGFHFNHFSNGAYKTPNLGINLPTTSVGAAWRIGQPEKSPAQPNTAQPAHEAGSTTKWQTAVSLVGGAKELYPAGGRKYGAATASVEQRLLLSYKIQLAASIDGFYNSSLQRKLANRSSKEPSRSDNFQAGVFFAVHQHMDRFTLGLGMGRYLLTKDAEAGNSYHRLVARWSFSDRITAQLGLKAHWFSADYVETGIVYNLTTAPWGSR